MKHNGWTLIELLVTMAIIAIIGAIAIPSYQDYVEETRFNVAKANANSLKVFMEEQRLEENTYVGDVSAPPYDEAALLANYEWTPEGDNNAYTYTVDAAATTWSIVVEHTNSQQWVRCEDRMSVCCASDNPGATRAACP